MEASGGTSDGNRFNVVVEVDIISVPSAREMAIGGAGTVLVATASVT